MGTPYLGGHRITGVRWSGENAIAVTFETSYANRLTQLYAGRSLIGVSEGPTDREILGELVPSESPPPLQLVSVLSEDRATDFGSVLGVHPYNRVALVMDADSYPEDAERIEFTAGTEPEGAVDPENVLGEVLASADGEHTFLTPPFNRSGEWNLAATPYDSRAEDGNAGDPLETSVTLQVHPPDVLLDDDGQRLRNIEVAAQTLTLEAQLA